jgi:molecular chaperone GrpE
VTDASAPRDDEQVPPSDEAGAAEAESQQAEHDTPPAADSAAAGVAGTPSLADLTAALEAAERQRDTYLDHLRRERAEFENFRRRSTRERMEATDRGAEALIDRLLGVLDNFGYVLEAAKDHDDAVAKGVRMVHDELREVLSKAGLEDVPGVGAPFDPTWHDAVMQVEGETTDDNEPTVAQVLRNGYRFKGRVLRPAAVAVTQ